MKRPLCSTFILACLTAAAAAQNQPTVEQLQSENNDARKQLAAAQDRKNELAAENEKLQKRLADLEKQLQTRTGERDALQDRSYFLREHYAAWEAFIDRNPSLKSLWLAYFSAAGATDTAIELLGDGKWPFELPG